MSPIFPKMKPSHIASECQRMPCGAEASKASSEPLVSMWSKQPPGSDGSAIPETLPALGIPKAPAVITRIQDVTPVSELSENHCLDQAGLVATH